MKFRIANFFGEDPASIIHYGLDKHPEIKEVHRFPIKGEALERAQEYDFLIMGSGSGLAPGERDYREERDSCAFWKRFDEKRLFDRTVIWDQRPDDNIWQWGIERCLVYFKKSWCKKIFPPKVHLLTWPILDLYVEIPTDLYNRDIDIGYYYGSLKDNRLAGDRGIVMKHIQNFNWNHAVVEFVYTLGGKYHGWQFWNSQPMIKETFNWWHVYMHFLRRTKILFTIPAGSHYFGNDRRTSEAMSSGALVFTDEPINQMPHPYEHGKHCFFFDSGNSKSINGALELAKSFLSEEKNEERKAIAKAGLEHGLKYHRTSNYIDYIVKIIKEARQWD